MTNQQLYIAIGLPTLAVITSLIISLIQIAGIRQELAAIREDVREIRAATNTLAGKVYELTTAIAGLKDLWRAELRRVEEVLDARLKHLEEK